MEKVKIGDQAFVLPMTVTILGCHLTGKPNFMTLAWLTRINFKPPLLGVAINKGNQSHTGVLDAGEFSVNFPSAGMVEIADYSGMVSAKKVDKSDLFEVFYGELKAAPMIKDCPLNIECKTYQTIDLPTNTFVIGEIIGAYSDERYLTDKVPDVRKINPLLLTMPDNRYWSVGENVGRAFSAGKAMRDRLKEGK